MSLFTFQIFKICLMASPSQTSPLQGATNWNTIIPFRNYSLSVVRYLSCSASQTHVSHVSQDGSVILILCTTVPLAMSLLFWTSLLPLSPYLLKEVACPSHRFSWPSLLPCLVDSRKSFLVSHNSKLHMGYLVARTTSSFCKLKSELTTSQNWNLHSVP